MNKVKKICANCDNYYGSVLKCKGCVYHSNWVQMTDENQERMKMEKLERVKKCEQRCMEK